MPKRDKLRNKLRNNPKAARFSQIETLLLSFGFTLDRVRGSHHTFLYRDDENKIRIVVPVHGNKVASFYVKEVLDILDEHFLENQEGGETAEEDDE